MSQKRNLVYYVILSIIGAVMVIVISSFGSSSVDSLDILDKLLVGGVFSASCIFGTSLALRPGWSRRFTKRGSRGLNRRQGHGGTGKRRGHHPDCRGFETHVINTKTRTLCAGCTGLAMGSVVSILLMSIYIILPARIPPTVPYVLIMLGMVLIAINYTEIVITIWNALLHLTSNVFLVISFFFVILGVFELTGNAVYGLIGIVMSFLWLDTRVQLSNWRHVRICGACSKICKAY